MSSDNLHRGYERRIEVPKQDSVGDVITIVNKGPGTLNKTSSSNLHGGTGKKIEAPKQDSIDKFYVKQNDDLKKSINNAIDKNWSSFNNRNSQPKVDSIPKTDMNSVKDFYSKQRNELSKSFDEMYKKQWENKK